MGKYRKRFNEKARTGMLAKQAALKRARNKQFYNTGDEHDETPTTEVEQSNGGNSINNGVQPSNLSTQVIDDPNAQILKPVTEEERLARKRALEENLFTQNAKEAKISKAKKKRLDKYIEHQLKREEKKILLEKLSETRMDTSKLSALKELGKGKLTKKEEMIEALELERQGRGDDRTRDILYETREVKEYGDSDEDNRNYFNNADSQEEEEEDEEQEGGAHILQNKKSTAFKQGDTNKATSSFVDNRPSKFGGSGFGFGFKNIPVIKMDENVPKKKYGWRKRIEMAEKKKSIEDEEDDFASSDDDDDHSDLEHTDSSGEEHTLDSETDDSDANDSEDEREEDDELIMKTNGKETVNTDTNGKNLLKDDYEGRSEDISEEEEEEEEEEDEEDTGSSNSSYEDEDDDEEEEEEEELDENDKANSKLMQSKPRHSSIAKSFKEWAEQQIKVAEGRDDVPLRVEVSDKVKEKYAKPTIHEEDIDHSSDEEGYIPVNKNLKRDAFVVDVQRSDEIQQQRIGLPVFAEEHRIMEAVYHHDCIILCGETGSGKTTQVPQFLYEAGFGNKDNKLYSGMIGITQPRRVAAVSMAKRVGQELGNHENRVGYQIRFDTTIKDEGTATGTAMKFMTDGVLLREMMSDFLLTKYSAIIIDEAHERNINTDILIGMLTRILNLRRKYHNQDPTKYKPLKLIIMSATLRVSDFSENSTLFKVPPPIINIETRQYPVSVHFNKKTEFEYLDEAFRKACKIHRKLPLGGILIFLTGQSEITTLVKILRTEFSEKKNKTKSIGGGKSGGEITNPRGQHVYKDNIDDDNDDGNSNHNTEVRKVEVSEHVQQEAEDIEFDIDAIDASIYDDKDDYNDDDEEEEEEEGFEEAEERKAEDVGPLHVLPLFSLLPTKEQMKVFNDPPKGSRLCVVSTNVAETSLTIPGIRYVIDCGRAKEKKFNKDNGVQSYEVDWISKASANQRAGRAGRTGPGHCYRLYSSAVFEEFFPQFSVPEILRTPFESVVLSMKSMGIDIIHNFPFPTPPDRSSLKNAERVLVTLGALDQKSKQITDLGKKMGLFPLSPRYAKILIVGNQQNCLDYIIAIVSALSVGNPFISENELIRNSEAMDEEARKELRSRFFKSKAMFSKLDSSSECMMLLSAVCAMDHVPQDKLQAFYASNFLRPKIMEEIQKLRKQLDSIVQRCLKEVDKLISDESSNRNKAKALTVPSSKQVGAMKQMIASGFVDQVAIRGDLISADVKVADRTRIISIPYCPVLPVSKDDPFVYIHANSLVANSGALPGAYIVYQSLSSKSSAQDENVKVRMSPLVDISGKQLTNIAKSSPLLSFSKPLGHPYAPKNLTPNKRECYVVPRFGATLGTGGVGWDLPAIKIMQEKKQGHWVLAETTQKSSNGSASARSSGKNF
ncbi:putative ATP-dependent RNA helicase DHR1 [Lodderomyces elongisporus]|uniref:putative ATP-dependent RNA helicase DHR1 n=1 Tax=Lodderomyces elongisporus TaxID=36914 RepID=UPI0029232075|nr:putative ATP-dependent RNA helicase DHR1 [Lodderomyces elongisporus]WLF77461.1 putative ATP-dependent RNA helicase DHR1 [Lodderomyces elongisporus]